MEEKIDFLSENYAIEGLLDCNSKDKGVVITHPHPLYGGNMYNFVVESIVSAYEKKGYATLRFNFRGAGKSQGSFDNGQGEQTDVRSAIGYLCQKGIKDIDLAGYSFGAWVNAQTNIKDMPVKNMVMVSPPVGFVNFDSITSIIRLKLVITGSRDEIAPVDLIKKMLPVWNQVAAFKVINGADHFYSAGSQAIEDILSDYI